MANALDKLERAKNHAAEKQTTSEHNLARLKHEYDAMSAERQDNNKAVEALRAQAGEVEKAMAEHLKTSEMELQELMDEYWKLRHSSGQCIHLSSVL